MINSYEITIYRGNLSHVYKPVILSYFDGKIISAQVLDGEKIKVDLIKELIILCPVGNNNAITTIGLGDDKGKVLEFMGNPNNEEKSDDRIVYIYDKIARNNGRVALVFLNSKMIYVEFRENSLIKWAFGNPSGKQPVNIKNKFF